MCPNDAQIVMLWWLNLNSNDANKIIQRIQAVLPQDGSIQWGCRRCGTIER